MSFGAPPVITDARLDSMRAQVYLLFCMGVKLSVPAEGETENRMLRGPYSGTLHCSSTDRAVKKTHMRQFSLHDLSEGGNRY